MAEDDALAKVDDETLELRMDQVDRCAKALKAGTSLSAFCKAEHIAPKTVIAWAKKLGVDLPTTSESDGGGWLAVELPKVAPALAPIEVELSGAVVRVPAGSSQTDIEHVLFALAALS